MIGTYLRPLIGAMSVVLTISVDATQPYHPLPVMPDRKISADPTAYSRAFDVSELNQRVNVCEDLNGFVNSNWSAAHPIPDDHTSWGTFDQLAENSREVQRAIVTTAERLADSKPRDSIEQKIGWFYRSGINLGAINQAGFKPLQPTLNLISALRSRADIVQFIHARHAKGNDVVFSFGSRQDYHNANLQIGYASQAGLGLPTKNYYTDLQYADIRIAYVTYMATLFRLIGTSAEQARRQADQVLQFETWLARATLTPVELRDPKNQYHFVSINQADKVTPHFSWKTFFTTQRVKIDRDFSLSQPKFFAEFDRLLAAAPVAQWQAYLRFHALNDAADYLSSPFQDAQFSFYDRVLAGQPQQKPRWKQVLDAINGGMGEALGQLYVARTFQPEAKQRAAAIAIHVSHALKTHLQNLDWMSDQTKAKALAKWHTFLPKIGYPDRWRDWSGLSITPDNYFGNVTAALQFNYDYALAKIGKPTDRHAWAMTPQTVNAYYDPNDNTINFPAAILQPPFFDAKADDALNYGGIGTVIGHEASHGFDDEGSQFDQHGNYKNWWTARDQASFSARAEKLARQFDHYTPLKDRPDLRVNGTLTLGENIADLGGLNVAYTALQTVLETQPQEARQRLDGYTPEQRFFLNWARLWRERVREKQLILSLNTDPHAPASFRVIGPPSNMEAFAAAFQCKPGDAMVRPARQRVKLW